MCKNLGGGEKRGGRYTKKNTPHGVRADILGGGRGDTGCIPGGGCWEREWSAVER